MNYLIKNWTKILTKVPVHVPTQDGASIAETIQVEVEAYQNPVDGEIYIPGESLEKLDEVKSRHMGLLLPEEIKELRDQLGITQKRMGGTCCKLVKRVIAGGKPDGSGRRAH